MAVLSNIKSHSDALDFFKEILFYNQQNQKPKPKIKHLKKY